MSELSGRGLVKITEPINEVLSLSDIKVFLRIEHVDEDDLLSLLIKAAREGAEEFMARSLISTGWELSLNEFCGNKARLPMRPIQNIVVVKNIDAQGNEVILDYSYYYINGAGDYIVFENEESASMLKIQYIAGYGDLSSNVPANIRQALTHHVAYMYENREGGGVIPDISKQLYAAYMEVRI